MVWNGGLDGIPISVSCGQGIGVLLQLSIGVRYLNSFLRLNMTPRLSLGGGYPHHGPIFLCVGREMSRRAYRARFSASKSVYGESSPPTRKDRRYASSRYHPLRGMNAFNINLW